VLAGRVVAEQAFEHFGGARLHAHRQGHPPGADQAFVGEGAVRGELERLLVEADGVGAIREPREPAAEQATLAFGQLVRDPELQLHHFLEGGEGRVARVEVVEDLPRRVVLLAVREQAGLAQQGLGFAFGAGLALDEQFQGRQGGALVAGRDQAVGLAQDRGDHGAPGRFGLVAGGGSMRVILRSAGDQQHGKEEGFSAKVHASEGGLRPR
jgi:hypothetical protein